MNKENFRGLLKKYKVKIPLIQRDYVHGRENPKVERILKNFLNDINDHLKNGKKLHLDFIYGKVTGNEFIPIDGQQRLTLLFLLYLYLGKKDKEDISFLKNFSYEVRASSREFCIKLVKKFDLPAAQEDSKYSISVYLKDQPWFIPQWEKDPTVSSMLKVLDRIHKDSEIKFEDLDNITFELFKLKDFDLDEDLYIRMNSRGRQLTEFELFKSKFMEFLENKEFKDELNKIKGEIDGKWCDFFWDYYRKIKEKTGDKEYLSIDKPILNFVYFITEMLGYESLEYESKKTNKNTEIKDFYDKEIEQLGFDKLFKLIYQNKEHVEFLIKVFDKLDDINSKSENIWGTFSKSNKDYEQNKGKVAIVSKEDEKDLLERAIVKKVKKEDDRRELNLMEKVLLFLLIKCTVKGLSEEKIKDLLRIVRNILIRIRARRSGKVDYASTLARKSLHVILKRFEVWIDKDIYSCLLEEAKIEKTDISKDSLEQEKRKAQIIINNPDLKEYIHKIEDHIYIRGDFTNLLWENIDFKEISERLYETFERKDEKIIPILIIVKYENNIDQYPYNISYNKVFFGRENHWELLLTQKDKDLSVLWKAFFTESKYLPNNWDKCRDEFLKRFDNKEKTWPYYFVKYSRIFEKIHSEGYRDFEKKDKNVYLLPKSPGSNDVSEDVKMLYRMLCSEKMRTDTAIGYHLNPFIYYVWEEVKRELPNCYISKEEKDGVHYGCGCDGCDNGDNNEFASYIVIKGEPFRIDACDTHLDKDLVEDLKEKLKKALKEKVEGEN